MKTNIRVGMILVATLATLATLAACSGSPDPVGTQADKKAIAAQMHGTWDRPDSPLDVGPIVVHKDYAIAGWTQGTMGGRALLKRVHGSWRTILCAGDGIRSADGLAAVGLPMDDAEALSRELIQAEDSVPADRLARMAEFRGLRRYRDTEG